ncbi:hypothetical protein CPB84DRAFT_1849134 [Gymnopilus junonius]|uniref:Uncharacterized protein n=1 Tax=Gymnopilus junonius TaxID=109634 RepID=A0A9P5TKZ4_GYMJU|nr:hypothetical protein CPB84DRAFT_1849134 [Gymnopilus junonius]
MPGSHRDLPTELLQTIFDILVSTPDSLPTLKAFSCASSRLCSISQPYLLRNVVLHQSHPGTSNAPGPTDCHDHLPHNPANHFLQALLLSPYIASYIQGLTLPMNTSQWLDDDTSLSQLLPLLVNLQRLSITGGNVWISRKPTHVAKLWTTFSAEAREALGMALKVHCLSEVDLTGIELFPLSLLGYCHMLQRLSVANFEVAEERSDGMVLRYGNTKRQLEYLHIEEAGMPNEYLIFGSPSWPFDLSSLHTLSISPRKVANLCHLPRNLTSLQHLQIHTSQLGTDTVYDQRGYLLRHHRLIGLSLTESPFQHFYALQSLTIDANFRIASFDSNNPLLIDCFSSPLSWITEFLNLSFKPNSEQSVSPRKLILKLVFSPHFPNEFFPYFDGGWRRLARCLDSEAFEGLEVELRVGGLSGKGVKVLRGNVGFQELVGTEGVVILSE